MLGSRCPQQLLAALPDHATSWRHGLGGWIAYWTDAVGGRWYIRQLGDVALVVDGPGAAVHLTGSWITVDQVLVHLRALGAIAPAGEARDRD